MAHSKEQAGLRNHTRQTIPGHSGYLLHTHTHWLDWRAGMTHLVGYSLTHSYSPRTRWRQWSHLIEQGTEGDITHGMQTNSLQKGLTSMM